MRWILTILAAAALTVFQIAFLSWMPAPFSLLSFAVIGISISVAAERPLEGALWAFVAGVLLDMHGLYGFGTRTALLFLVFAVQRVLFSRVLTNASKSALFLLTLAGVAAEFVGLMAIDGMRVVFGGTPYLLSFEPDIFYRLIGSALANGLAVVLCLYAVNAFRRRFESVFIPHR